MTNGKKKSDNPVYDRPTFTKQIQRLYIFYRDKNTENSEFVLAKV
jgi:hypothetical protein